MLAFLTGIYALVVGAIAAILTGGLLLLAVYVAQACIREWMRVTYLGCDFAAYLRWRRQSYARRIR